MRSIEWFIARRYLFSRERKALVSVITLISVAGVAVGVAALIVVIGVMDGADTLLYGKIADLYPHIRIVSMEGPEAAIDQELIARLRARDDVLFAEPIIDKLTVIQKEGDHGTELVPARLIGMDELGKDSLYTLKDTNERPLTDADGNPIRLGPREIMLGLHLAARLEATRGSTLVLNSNDAIPTAMGARFKWAKVNVRGYFLTGFYEFDDNFAFVSNEEIRKLYRIEEGHGADYIHVKLKNPFEAEKVKRELDLKGYHVRTWAEENGAFFSALQLEKLGLFIILLLIILVAAFNIIGTLILMVIEKTREIGILKAMGGSRTMIARIFMLDGVIIGLVGTLAGLVIGLIICALIPLVKIDMAASIYNFDHLPVEVRPLTVAAIVVCSMAICTLAALFPAVQAGRLKPVEALRHD